MEHRPGKYRHFKGGMYRLLYSAVHSETGESMIVYQALYGDEGIFVRPASMWDEAVLHDGRSVPRFKFVGDVFLETTRLVLRRMDEHDFDDIAEMLRDSRVMYAWERTFSDEEILAWIDRRKAAYAENGYSHFLAVDKQSGIAVGQVGILMEEIDGEQCLGIGWILKHRFFGCGYASEAARACISYAFDTLGAVRLIADIRPENRASIAVAERIGMTPCGEFVKHVSGKEMVHTIFEVRSSKD